MRLKNIFTLIAIGWCCTGCATYDAYHARFREPNYLVTRAFYETPPDRVAVLPFASRSGRETDDSRAEICRRVFFQHFSLLPFHDVEMGDFDRMLARDEDVKKGPLRHVLGTIRALDLVGMTSVVNLETLLGKESIDYAEFRDSIERARDEMHSDSYAAGIMRSYGRLYLVVLSSIGISTRVELRSSDAGILLWRGEAKKRNLQIPISLNPIDIPYLLYYTWANSRGVSMDMLAYGVYRDLVATIPPVYEPVEVFVKPTRAKAPWFRKPTVWRFLRAGRVSSDERFKFVLEQRGWYQCRSSEGEMMWLFRRDADVVDANDTPVPRG